MNKIDISKYKTMAGDGQSPSDSSEGGSSIVNLLNKDITLFGGKLDAKRKEWFYSELYIMLSAGIDTKTSLELIAEESKKKKEKKIFEQIRDQVIAGKNISEVLKTIPDFSSYEYHSVEIGEETGQLNEVLGELATFYANQVKLKRQIIGTLSYPMVIVFVAVGAVSFMLTMVVPMFKDIFKRMGADLPTITKVIIKFSAFATSYFFYIFLVIAGIAFTMYTQRKKDWYRDLTSRIVLRIPLIGPLVGKIYVARFCQSMKLLLSAHTRLVDALELVEKMIGYYPIEQALKQIREDVFKGQSLHTSLGKFPIFSKRMVSLLKVAEEVNRSSVIFEKLAKQLSDEVDHQNAIISKLIEPIFIVVLGAVIGFILVGMYLPLFEMSTSVGG